MKQNGHSETPGECKCQMCDENLLLINNLLLFELQSWKNVIEGTDAAFVTFCNLWVP